MVLATLRIGSRRTGSSFHSPAPGNTISQTLDQGPAASIGISRYAASSHEYREDKCVFKTIDEWKKVPDSDFKEIEAKRNCLAS